MDKHLFIWLENRRPVGLVLLAIVLALAAGSSALIFQSSLAPLILIGIILAVAFSVVLLIKPAWALYTAVFIVFLPQQVIQLIPVALVTRYLTTLVLLLAGCSWLIKTVVAHRKIIWTSSMVLMIAFIIWCAITLFWAPDLTLGRQFLISQLLGLLLVVLIANHVGSMSTLDGLMSALELIGWMLVILGVVTVLGSGYLPGTRLNILGVNENEFGVQLVLAMAGVLWQALRPDGHHRALKRAMSFIYITLVIALIAMSGSRGSMISVVIILLAFTFWKPTRIWGIFSLIILVAGVLLSPMMFSTLMDRFAISRGDTLLGGREALWQATWNLILDHPMLGVGVGNARHALVPYVVLLRSIEGADSAATHNPILQVWAETGLPGVLLFLSVLVSATWLFIRHFFVCLKKKAQSLIPYFAILSSIFLGYMASWIKSGGVESNLSYFLFLAMLAIPAGLHLRSEMTEDKKIPSSQV